MAIRKKKYVQAHSFKNIDTEDVDVKDHIITPEVENDVIPQNAKKSKIFGSMWHVFNEYNDVVKMSAYNI